MQILSRIFPRQFDNTYRGHWLAILLFVPAMALTAAQGAFVMLMARQTLPTADGIALDGLGANGASLVVSITAVLGLFTLILPVQSIVVLLRYRAMISFMYLCLLVLEIGNRVVLKLNPIVRTASCSGPHTYMCSSAGGTVHHSGYYVSWAIFAMVIVGFVLSLVPRSGETPALARGTPP
ncbi:MAG TPA: hypothetical protein VII56_19865 [Rhizomicrobium sp.]